MQTFETTIVTADTCTSFAGITAVAESATSSPDAISCVLCASPHEGPAGGLCRPCFALHVGDRRPQLNLNKTRIRREPVFMTDTDGAEIALMTTNKVGMTVKMLAADLRDLLARGFTDQVTVVLDAHSGYFYANVNVTGMAGGMVGLSRLIMDAKRGKNVKCLDGDRLNLCRNNLVIVKGHGKNVVQVANRIKAGELRAAAERP